MKKFLFSTIFIVCFLFSKAQMDFSQLKVELAGNYTMYKSSLQQNTPGAKLRISVPVSDKASVGLGFTYGFAIKQPSTVTLSPSGSVASEIVYNFKTISLEGNYFFGEEKEEGFNAYGIFGAALVLASYQENLKTTIPASSTPTDQIEKQNESGFTINGGLGGQYSLGRSKIFAEALIALPANQTNGQYVENVIPTHFIFNVGLRFSLSSN